MTKDEINRRVAEKVMGWKVITLKPSSLQMPIEVQYLAKLPRYTESPNDPSLKMPLAYWNPAERWDHAGMVVEKLIADKRMIIGSLIYDEVYGGWRFRYRAYEELLHPDSGPWADIAPMAICLASLEAVKENRHDLG